MEQKRTGLPYVFTLAKEERGKLGLGMLLAVFSSALSLVPYMVVYQILLLIIKNEVTLHTILKWAGIGIGAAVLQAIFTALAGICSHTAAFNTMHRIKVRVLEHMSKFNLGYFQEHAPGQIKTTLFDDVDRIENFLAHSTLELAQAIVVPLMMFLFMLRLNWKMALIMLIPMILGIAIPMALMGRYPDLTDEFAGDTEKLNASANEFITAMPVIKMYHLTAEKFEQYRTALKVYTDCWIKMCESSCNPLSIALVVLDSAILFTLPVGGWLYLQGSLSVASFLLFILLTMCFFTSFLNLVTIAMQSMELGSGLDHVKQIMDMEVMQSGNKELPKTGSYGIDFAHVTFRYTKEGEEVLSDIDLHLKAGSINAFVGPSGAGKTTAAQLMSWLQEKDDTAICGILTSEKWWERSEYRMLHSIKKLIGDKGRQLIVPIVLMSLDAIGSLVMYLMLYFTVVHLLSGTLSGTLVRNYTIVCLISVILRLIIYRSGYFLCFSRGAKMCSNLRLQLANHYRSLSLGYFNQNSSGYLLTTLTKDLSNFELVLTHTLPSIIKTLVMGVLILTGTFFINWKLALAECVVILIALPILHQGNVLVEKYGKMKRDLTSKMVSIVLEYIKGMKVFKSANMTSTHFARMSDTLEDIRKTNVQAEVKTAVPTSMYSIVANFLLPFVLLIGSYLFLGGSIASQQLVAFMLMSLALSALLIAFEHSYGLLKELRLAAFNLEQAFDTKPLPYREEQVTLKHFDVAFDHVSFSYNLQTEVLHDIGFHAKEGSTTALIGPSGSGKSTVANLIARFFDVTKGSIRIGGKDIRQLNPDGLLQYISEVFQENTLLSDTIYNNIKAGRENATEEEIISAAKAAHCHEFIVKLPKGYQTKLSEGGNTLSGGEKQRIAIARAILKDAPILLLDESTASLDADNEAKINQALDHLMKGKTVFVIAHRLNTIQNADQIIVLNDGKIEEMGTHDMLLKKQGHYYAMVQEQQKAKEWIVKGA